MGSVLDLSRTVSLAHKRIYGRSLAHSTLFPSPELPGVLANFARSWQGLGHREKQQASAVIRVDITLPLSGVIQVKSRTHKTLETDITVSFHDRCFLCLRDWGPICTDGAGWAARGGAGGGGSTW
jgi:hypothetical protein